MRIALFVLLGSGCNIEDSCDPGFREVHGACFAAGDTDSDSDTGSESASDTESASETVSDTGGGCGAPFSGFGAVCTVTDECECAATLCAVQPGSDQGFCTWTGDGRECPMECPANWTCLDVSAFTGKYDWMCVCDDFRDGTCPNPIP